ncbi:hypothetical protein ACFQ0T_06035 [Kitasatospora gansuensis]
MAAADRERLRTVAAALRVAVFQLLMGGEVTLAQRTAEGLAAGLLDAEHQRVYVLEGPAAERDALALRCTEATGGRALVVRCPAYDQHLIVVAPLRGPVTEDGWDGVGLTLRDLLADRPDRYLGGSGRCRSRRPRAATGTPPGRWPWPGSSPAGPPCTRRRAASARCSTRGRRRPGRTPCSGRCTRCR